MKNNIDGVGVALITPFDKDGGVDYDALGNIVDYVTANGADYLVVLGTTAETPTLGADEKKSVVSYIKQRNASRLPIIIGAGGYSTEEVIKTIDNTDLDGVSAILSVTPYYNKPTQEGLYQHYKTVAGHSPVPVLLYNVPSRTGVNMHADTTLRLAYEIKNIMGIKEACGNIPQMSALLTGRPEGFKVISGDDCLAVPLVALGGDGIISVAANAFPKDFCAMVAATYEGDRQKTAQYNARLFEAMEALFEEGNPAGVKTALSIKGLCGNSVRLPLVAGSQHLHVKLEDLIRRHNI